MKEFLYFVIAVITKAHNSIMSLNDGMEYNFTDKELHFIVIGIMGLLMIFVVHPVILWLTKHGHIMTISFIYVFTAIIVITFAIEIGQKATGTGHMEFADIAAGVLGFLVMFAVFAAVRALYHWAKKLIEKNSYKGKH